MDLLSPLQAGPSFSSSVLALPCSDSLSWLPCSHQLDQAVPCHQRLRCQGVVPSAGSCCHFLWRTDTVPYRPMPVCPSSLGSFWLCSFCVFFRPSVSQPSQRPGNCRCDVLTSPCSCFGLHPDHPPPPWHLRMALLSAGSGLFFFTTPCQVHIGRPLWLGDQACQKRHHVTGSLWYHLLRMWCPVAMVPKLL